MSAFLEEIALMYAKGLMEDERDLPRYKDKAAALAWLRELSGEDFGEDLSLWERWVQIAVESKRTPRAEGRRP